MCIRDRVTTARRKRVKDIRVNGALLPVVVLAVKRSVDDILSRTYAYLELEEGKALLQQGLATLSEIIDAGEFNAPVFVGHHRYHTFEGTIIHVREDQEYDCLLYTSPSPRDKRQSRMPSSA